MTMIMSPVIAVFHLYIQSYQVVLKMNIYIHQKRLTRLILLTKKMTKNTKKWVLDEKYGKYDDFLDFE